MTRLAALFVLGCLAACQSTPDRDEDSPFYSVPDGSKLVLNRAIVIPADSLKIYIQDGRLGYAPNQYYPFCKFELRWIKPVPQTVEPGEFDIYSTRRVTDLIVGLGRSSPFMSVRLGRGDLNDGKPSPVVFGTRMDLRSAQQPDVFRLTCGHLQDPNLEARYVTIKQIRAALGDIFTLQIPLQQP